VRELMNGVPSRAVLLPDPLFAVSDGRRQATDAVSVSLPAYSGAAQMQEVVETLRQRQLPYIVAFTGPRPG
jgi:hypothetical protein